MPKIKLAGSDIITMICEEKEPTSKINLAILQFLYPDFDGFYERYGVLIHPVIGIPSAIPLPNYLGSLEATLEAVNKLMPQAEWSIFHGSHGMYEGTVWVENEDGSPEEFSKLHQNAASALLIAAFQAKEYKEKQDED
jgi:hypothetical protein